MTARRLRELFWIAMALIAIWIVAGLFTASEFYRRAIAVGGRTEYLSRSVLDIVSFQIAMALNWATVTPIIVAIAERLPFRKPHLLRNSAIMLGLVPLIGLARAIMGGIVNKLGEHDVVTMAFIRLSVSIRLHRYIAITAVIVVVTNLILAQREAAARARKELAAQTLLARAELDALRAQMQPHFLFLTLQAIAETVERDPAKADEMIVGLAGLLRRSLTLGGDAVPLAEEFDFVEQSLALYRICFDGRLAVRFEADDEVLASPIPPLVVQQLVEDAVVNRIAPAGGGAIEIRGWRDDGQLRLEVRDGQGVAGLTIPMLPEPT